MPPESSRIGFGSVRHRRHAKRAHAFNYSMAMPLLNLDELPEICGRSRLWSLERRNWISWKREDYLGDPTQALKQVVLDKVEEQLGLRLDGAVLQLAQPRYFGYVFNPLALYFCFDANKRLRACLAEVTSTPWGEKVCYAMAIPPGQSAWTHCNAKAMHVSPFLAMDMEYRWKLRWQAERLTVHIANYRDGEREFDATLDLNLIPADASGLRRTALGFPLMTIKIIAAIHWQALRLWLKGVPFIPRDQALESA